MPLSDTEEYIEQAYFWSTFHERLLDGMPAQEIIVQVYEEILSTTKLPMALDFLVGEIRHKGLLSDGMQMMPHYFTPFQSFIMAKAEDETVKFDLLIALKILQHEAEYRPQPYNHCRWQQVINNDSNWDRILRQTPRTEAF